VSNPDPDPPTVCTVPVVRYHLFQSQAKNCKMATKNCLKDKLEDDELDLSMMQLTDVPVKVGLTSSVMLVTSVLYRYTVIRCFLKLFHS
jgi:hypothetical protein